MGEREPTEAEVAELARRMQEELRSLSAAEVLSQTGITLVNLAAARMGMVDGVPDDQPTEARRAIDALGALLPVIEQHAQGPLIEDLRAGLAQLRMAFVELSGGAPATAEAPAAPPPEAAEAPRARIWTPRGDV